MSKDDSGDNDTIITTTATKQDSNHMWKYLFGKLLKHKHESKHNSYKRNFIDVGTANLVNEKRNAI